MRIQRLPKTFLIAAVAISCVHPQWYARLVFSNQLQYHLIQVRLMVATIALSDMSDLFRRFRLLL